MTNVVGCVIYVPCTCSILFFVIFSGSSTIMEWPDYQGAVMYDEEWPWVGRRPVAPRSGQSWHTIRFTASRCDGVFNEKTNTVKYTSNTVQNIPPPCTKHTSNTV